MSGIPGRPFDYLSVLITCSHWHRFPDLKSRYCDESQDNLLIDVKCMTRFLQNIYQNVDIHGG
jgi:hypothetical protein